MIPIWSCAMVLVCDPSISAACKRSNSAASRVRTICGFVWTAEKENTFASFAAKEATTSRQDLLLSCHSKQLYLSGCKISYRRKY